MAATVFYTCAACNGTGRYTSNTSLKVIDMECPYCNGKGGTFPESNHSTTKEED